MQSESKAACSPPGIEWPVATRRCVSALIAIHLIAVFAAPWSSPPPAPLLAEKVANSLRPYIESTYLNHGYRFFAPDPGPSHIVRFELTRADGTVMKGQIPDPKVIRPRLLYHRYFMMTETLFQLHNRLREVPADAKLDVGERQNIESENAHFRSLMHSLSSGIARQLLKRYEGRSVHLYLQEHAIPFPDDVSRGMQLDTAELYSDLRDLGAYTQPSS